MREILHRGKRKDNGEWVYGDILKSDEQRFIVPVMGVSCVEEYEHADTNKFIQLYAYEVIPETVCQHTGLNDKSGKKIFEGDIIKIDEYVKETFGVEDGKVFYYGGSFLIDKIRLLNSICVFVDCEYVLRGEAIGNIFDNPELLKGADSN